MHYFKIEIIHSFVIIYSLLCCFPQLQRTLVFKDFMALNDLCVPMYVPLNKHFIIYLLSKA